MALWAGSSAWCFATLISYEGFSTNHYVAGDLLGQNPVIAGYSGNWSAPNGTAVLTLPGYTYSAGGDALLQEGFVAGQHAGPATNLRMIRSLDTAVDGAFNDYLTPGGLIGKDDTTLWASFVMYHDAANNVAADFAFRNGTADTNKPLRIYSAWNSGTFKVASNTTTDEASLTSRNNATNFFVIKFEFLAGNDVVTVYQNPTDFSMPSGVITGLLTTADVQFNRIGFERFSGAPGTPGAGVDEIRFGTSWESVVAVIPEPGALGLLLAGLATLRLLGYRSRLIKV